jgi:Ras GTPase-activating protein 1
MAARSLIMVAKCLQNLANLVEFGGKEPYMEVVNPFILKNKERMVVFLDQLSVIVLIIHFHFTNVTIFSYN